LVSITDAAAMNRNYRKACVNHPKGVYISEWTLNQILSQEDCVGIRFYFAMDDDGKMRLTYAGVKANEDDILGLVGNMGVLCPPSCGVSNALNS